MHRAYRNLQRIKREQAALNELPVAQLTSLTANLNRDPSKNSKAFTLQDFAFFYEKDESNGFPPNAALAAMALRREDKLPHILLGAWPQILVAAKQATAMPSIRAFVSKDKSVALLAPNSEGKNWRGLLAVQDYPSDGKITLIDVDKPLLTYNLQLPKSQNYSFISSGELLLAI